jgi:hypothetical protein
MSLSREARTAPCVGPTATRMRLRLEGDVAKAEYRMEHLMERRALIHRFQRSKVVVLGDNARLTIVMLVTLFLTIAGCDLVTPYSGAGRLIDNGIHAATDRYIIDLGPISLKALGTSTYKFKNLPKENFVIGLELSAPSHLKLDRTTNDSVVSIALKQDGNLLWEKAGKLSEWTWSISSPGHRAFVYGRGESSTYFEALPRSEYEISMHVRHPDHDGANYMASLVAKAGGWK